MKLKEAKKVLSGINSDVFDVIGMTEIQARRAKMLLKGLNFQEIAIDENANRSGVISSIEAAVVKVRKAKQKLSNK
jgi:SNF2 family DNA or RNA helicase